LINPSLVSSCRTLLALQVQRVESQASEVFIVACAVSVDARCSSCDTPSTSVRGRYQRRVADLPIGGLPVHLELQVRRLRS
jgi:transposase